MCVFEGVRWGLSQEMWANDRILRVIWEDFTFSFALNDSSVYLMNVMSFVFV